MGSITINGKKVKSITINGKNVKSLTMGGKVLTLTQPTVDPNVWHYGDGAGGPDLTKNDWKGSFSSPTKQAEFEALTTSVSTRQFINEPNLTGISLPNVISIAAAGIYFSPLTYINIPKATDIGFHSIYTLINNSNTEIWLNKKFNNDAGKDLIFGAGHWTNITFHWTNDDGSEYVPSPNTFTGTFSTPAKQAEFMAAITSVSDNQFKSENSLTGISLPKATTIGAYAFLYSPLTSLDLPKVTTIGGYAFQSSKLTILDLPEATTIWERAFYYSKLTSITLPKVTTIGDKAFSHIVNAASTTVTLPSKFNDDAEKTRIFGTFNWEQITFHWV